MSSPPMTARRQLRLAVLAALKNATSAVAIDSPGDWTTQPPNMPAILVRSPRGSKEAFCRGAFNFTSTVAVEIETKVLGKTGPEAQDNLEAFDAEVEAALFTNHAFIALVQQVTIDVESEVSSEGRHHYGGTKFTIRCEVAEAFDPVYDAPSAFQPVAVSLDGMNVHADLVNVFDPNGTYPNGAFPAATLPAPRGAGPDGRDEGGLSINFPH
jgi:hypothetical protein